MVAVGVLVVWCLSLICTTQAGDIDLYKFHIISDITYRFATTNVTSYLVNKAWGPREAEFKLTIPKEAFINKFFLMIDGKIYHGSVREKAEAQQQYDAAKKLGQSAGQIKATNSKPNTFEVQVNIAAASRIVFSLTSQELLQRKQGVYDHVINLDPGQLVEDFKVEVYIHESKKIMSLKVPELRQQHQNSITNQENPDAVVQRISDTEARITYAPDLQAQMDASWDGVAGQFVVQYDVERTHSGGELLVVDGYFVHFFAPSDLQPIPQDIMFILDVSGSMSGTKLEQVQIAMKKIISSLRPQDRFNIITFATNINLWKQQGFRTASPSNLAEAKRFLRQLTATGSTNINDALLQGIEFMKTHKLLPESTNRPAMVIFLTDGNPNESEKIPANIVRNLVAANEGYAVVYSLGFGDDVKFDFLKRLSLQNHGFARKIYLNADSALQVQNFYKEVSTPLLTHVNITYLGNTVDSTTITQTSCHNLYEGSECVVAGKLSDRTRYNVISQVSAESATGLLELDTAANETEAQALTTMFDVNHFTERLWAYLTIKKMLDKTLQQTDATLIANTKQKALDLALQYQFVTPLTSMVVIKPNEGEYKSWRQQNTEVSKKETRVTVPPVRRVTNPKIQRPRWTLPPWARFRNRNSGSSGIHIHTYNSYAISHGMKGFRGVMGDIATTTTSTTTTTTTTTTTAPPPVSTCLTVSGGNGDLFQLIYDQQNDIVVNGEARITRNLPTGHSIGQHLYFSRIAIMHSSAMSLIRPNMVYFNGDILNWNAADGTSGRDMELSLTAEDDLIVKISSSLSLKFISHGDFLEVQRVSGGLDSRCSVFQNYQSGRTIMVWNRQMLVSHLIHYDRNTECLQAFTKNDRLPNTSCNSIQNGQWEVVEGKRVRYFLPFIQHQGSAVEFEPTFTG